MAGLIQKRFAALLAAGMKAMDVTNAEVSRITAQDGGKAKVDRNTMTDYLDPAYPSGPPKRETRARLERAIDLPEGYLDGDVEVDLQAWRKQRRQRVAEEAVRPYEPNSEAMPGGEEHLRDLLRAVRLTSAALARKEGKHGRLILLGALLAYRHSVELTGKPVPPYFDRIRGEIEHDRFE